MLPVLPSGVVFYTHSSSMNSGTFSSKVLMMEVCVREKEGDDDGSAECKMFGTGILKKRNKVCKVNTNLLQLKL